jgi:hypothetical protein
VIGNFVCLPSLMDVVTAFEPSFLRFMVKLWRNFTGSRRMSHGRGNVPQSLAAKRTGGGPNFQTELGAARNLVHDERRGRMAQVM